MPKASRIDFDQLKARADFRTVLAHYGLSIVGCGDQTKIRCPFHDDERPSCSVNLRKGLLHCFACQARGNVLDFVHRMETKDSATVSLREAGRTLATICGLELDQRKGAQSRQEARRRPQGRQTTQEPSRRANRAPEGSGELREDVEGQAQPSRNKPLSFQLTLDPAHPYFAERGLSPELVELFGLGFCAKGSMAGRVCIPIENANGELVAYVGRFVGSEHELPAGEEKYKLPAGFHKTLELWNLHRVKHCRHLIVVEGYFGAIRLHGLRLPAVALMGSSIAEEQVALFQQHCPALRFVTVLMDGDETGQKAGDIVTTRLAKHWWTRDVVLPDGAQPDTVEKSVLEQLLGREQK